MTPASGIAWYMHPAHPTSMDNSLPSWATPVRGGSKRGSRNSKVPSSLEPAVAAYSSVIAGVGTGTSTSASTSSLNSAGKKSIKRRSGEFQRPHSSSGGIARPTNSNGMKAAPWLESPGKPSKGSCDSRQVPTIVADETELPPVRASSSSLVRNTEELPALASCNSPQIQGAGNKVTTTMSQLNLPSAPSAVYSGFCQDYPESPPNAFCRSAPHSPALLNMGNEVGKTQSLSDVRCSQQADLPPRRSVAARSLNFNRCSQSPVSGRGLSDLISVDCTPLQKILDNFGQELAALKQHVFSSARVSTSGSDTGMQRVASGDLDVIPQLATVTKGIADVDSKLNFMKHDLKGVAGRVGVLEETSKQTSEFVQDLRVKMDKLRRGDLAEFKLAIREVTDASVAELVTEVQYLRETNARLERRLHRVERAALQPRQRHSQWHRDHSKASAEDPALSDPETPYTPLVEENDPRTLFKTVATAGEHPTMHVSPPEAVKNASACCGSSAAASSSSVNNSTDPAEELASSLPKSVIVPRLLLKRQSSLGSRKMAGSLGSCPSTSTLDENEELLGLRKEVEDLRKTVRHLEVTCNGKGKTSGSCVVGPVQRGSSAWTSQTSFGDSSDYPEGGKWMPGMGP